MQINPRTAAKDPMKILEETGTKVSISTARQVLYRHNLKGRSARKKPLLQNRHKKSQTMVCNCTNIVLYEEMSSGLMKQK
jgi:hypothetical protein